MSSIDILPSDEQREIVDGLSRALSGNERGKTSVSAIAELGFLGAGLPEDHGGFGLSIADETLLHVEFGRSVADLSILATMLAARYAAASEDGDRCEALVSGEATAGFVMPRTFWTPDGAEPSGDVHLLGEADVFLALSPRGGALVPAEAFADVQPRESMDATATLARASLPSGSSLGWSDEGAPSIWRSAIQAIAAQLTGIAMATRNMGAEYAKTREQFGKPIGSFQGVAHPLAECALRAGAAENQLLYAAIALRDGFPDAGCHVTSAWLVAMDAALRNATVNIQVHGAMGYSAETGAHLFLKRAIALRQISGGVRTHEQALLDPAA